MISLKTLVGFLVHVRNPLPAFLDRVGLRKTPYHLRTRDGLDMVLRCNGGDRFAFYENLIRKYYLRKGQILNPGDTVIDIGANIGCFSVLAARIVGSGGCVLSVEPDPATYRLLEDNVQRNFPNDHVLLRQVAVGGHSGTTKLISADNPSFSSIYDHVDKRTNVGTTANVEVVTTKQLMDEAGIERCKLLKVNCEGAEYEIFETMTREISSRIEQISMEVHDIDNHSKSDLMKNLSRLGYRILSERTRALYARHENTL